MLYTTNMNLKKFKQYSGYIQTFLKQVNWNYGIAVLTYLFLNLGKNENDENNDSDFKILLHFEKTIVAK